MTAAVKYCGGCNPRYDRTGALAELKAALPGVRFVPAAPGQAADALLVLCGCTARCADLTGLEAGMHRETEQVWQCRNCGFIYIGTHAPVKCPVCAHPQAYFELRSQNY